MTFSDGLLLGFFLLLGIPCLFLPRQVQWLVLAANERLGYIEPPSGIRRTPTYLRRLRLLGAFIILGAVLMAFADDIARFVI